MPISANPDFRLIALRDRAPRRQVEDLIVSYAASLAINAIFVLLMILEVSVRIETPPVQETPVEVIIEAPPPVADPESKAEVQRFLRRPRPPAGTKG